MYAPSKVTDLLRFARVEAGSKVVDVFPGKGEWTRAFSDAVGPQGRVYSLVPAEVAGLPGDPVASMQALAKEPGRGNIEVVSTGLTALPDDLQGLDVVWIHLFYHDLHRPSLQTQGATPEGFNRQIYDRLKPGGAYAIVDHAAAAARGARDADTLHRIEPATARAELEAAGFVFDGQSTPLANDDDPHSAKVFDPSIKGETDRFAYRFLRA